MADKPLFDEQIAEGIAQAAQADADALIALWTAPDGRSIGTVKLSDEEIWARFQDPQIREQMLNGLAQSNGPDAAHKFLLDLQGVEQRLVNKAVT